VKCGCALLYGDRYLTPAGTYVIWCSGLEGCLNRHPWLQRENRVRRISNDAWGTLQCFNLNRYGNDFDMAPASIEHRKRVIADQEDRLAKEFATWI
jgi:hypothetical protein